MSAQQQSGAVDSSNKKKRRRPYNNNDDQRAPSSFQLPAWKRARELPDFLDASASVSASTFGARRLPEIRALWNATTTATSSKQQPRPPEESFKSSGCKTSSRHLRRRVTSHNSRKRYRYPNGNHDGLVSLDKGKSEATSVSRKTWRNHRSNLTHLHESWWRGAATTTATTTTRTTAKEKDTQEAEEEEEEAASKLESSPTTSGGDKGVQQQKDEQQEIKQKKELEKTNPKTTTTSTSTTPNNNNKRKKRSPPLDWLTTHLWHAKRFHMADLWGWQIPMVHTNRGPKAALRLIRQEGKTLLQDVTYAMAARPIILTSCHTTTASAATATTTTAIAVQNALRRLCPEYTSAAELDPSSSTASSSNSSGNTTTTRIQRGQGIFYKLDQFPNHAIGPVTWIVTRDIPLTEGGHATGNLLQEGEKSSADHHLYYYYFWTHPAIHSDIWKELETLVRESHDDVFLDNNNLQVGFPPPISTSTGSNKSVGISCFKLLGTHATSTLQKVLAAAAAEDVECNNKTLIQSPAGDRHLKDPNGTAMTAIVNLDHQSPSPSPQNNNTTDSAKQSTTSTLQTTSSSSSSSTCLIRGHQILMISYCVRDPQNLPQNAPAVGWHVYCDNNIASALFVRLVVHAGACPIGILEQAYINLECQPPLVDIFPRDFVETPSGQEYWRGVRRGDNYYDCCGGGESRDWNVLRLCLEEGQGGGRVPVPTIKLRCSETSSEQTTQKQLPNVRTKISIHQLNRIQWGCLTTTKTSGDDDDDEDDTSDNDNTEDSSVVMMRGMFGRPLVDALAGSGKMADVGAEDEGEKNKKPKRRRNRRPKRHPNELCHVMPLSREKAQSQVNQCTKLLQALSLPAVVACLLQVVGPGTLQPGAPIYATVVEDDDEVKAKSPPPPPPLLLGYVTAASFSVTRGRSHGTGIVSASRFLRTIIAALSNVKLLHKGLAVVDTMGTRSIQLVVQVSNGRMTTMKATLGLQL